MSLRSCCIQAKSEKSLDDIPILLKRIDELENAQKNSIEVQKRLRLKIREQQKVFYSAFLL